MNKEITSSSLALRLWLFTALSLSTEIVVYSLLTSGYAEPFVIPIVLLATSLGSIPSFIALLILLPIMKRLPVDSAGKMTGLVFVFLFISVVYGALGGMIDNNPFYNDASLKSFFTTTGICIAYVFGATITAFLINIKRIKNSFSSTNKKIQTMNENSDLPLQQANQNGYSNKIWIKGIITAALILLMLIPTVFVSNLVEERQARQQEVKNEVSSKWAGEQNITFPYLFIPYNSTIIKPDGKAAIEKRSFLILPENLNVSGSVTTEQRQRSIYSVLLYNSSLIARGNFNIQAPGDIDVSTIDWSGAKLCLGISDFKGIQQKITAKINNTAYDFSAGLPTNQIDTTGLSASINLGADNLGKAISFELPLKIKGSDELHFVPLAGNSQFTLNSNWSSPSFDGNTLPSERRLNDKGFEASWSFNKANLPFNTLLKNFNFKKDDYAFGVSLLQPTDQYAKTLRCVKYAILFIGLSFSLFFIVEIMQKRPFHPVQYVLVGLALIVFYTLLLSISEFLLFDIAYLIAAFATVSLVTLYSKSHFKSWKVAGVFAGVTGAIYSFIFVLIRLEDTALLVGSIGLFIILALAMYASRKINWYGNAVIENAAI